MMFGFACDETQELMPMPISFAHKICARLTEAREKKSAPVAAAHGKSQVTVRYVDGVPREVTAVVCSTQHAEEVGRKALTEGVLEEVVLESRAEGPVVEEGEVLHQPDGAVVVGGPHGDTGLTGPQDHRDTYGVQPAWRRGFREGSFQGRIAAAAYMAGTWPRTWSPRVLRAVEGAAGLRHRARRAGVDPVETFGTAERSGERIGRAVMDTFDMRPPASSAC